MVSEQAGKMAQAGEDGSRETRPQRVSSSRQYEVTYSRNCRNEICRDVGRNRSLETFSPQSSSNVDVCRFRFRSVAGPALGLPGDPWLTPPGLLSALPGFLAAPHTGYPSYLTSPRRLPSPPNVGTVGSAVPGETFCSNNYTETFAP